MARKKEKEFLEKFERIEKADGSIKDIVPKQLMDCFTGRKPGKAQRVRQYFLKFTDRTYRTPGEELWEDLLHIKLYLDLHVILYDISQDTGDSYPVLFYYAEVPEILLEMLGHALEKDFYFGSSKLKCIPSLAIFILTDLHHINAATFTIVPDRIFRDSEKVLLEVTQGAFEDRYMWYDKLSVVQYYGVASCSGACLYFLFKHMDILGKLLWYTYHSREIIDEKIRNEEINWQDENQSRFLSTFRDGEDVVLSAQFFGIFVTNHSVIFFWNILNSAKDKIDLFKTISKEIMDSKILEHFMFVVKNLMTWFDPGLFLSLFLVAVMRCLKIRGAMESLVMKDLHHAIENKRPLGIETFHFWNHETKAPNTIAWLLLHAFTLNSKMGYKECIYILCYILDNAERRIVDQIVANFGLDLIDLAHFLEFKSPEALSVQSVVLQALLRYSSVHHKVYGRNDLHEGDFIPSDKIKEYVLEAILFCKKAQCEASMSEEEKQKLAAEADKVKEQGNEFFKSENYREAIIKYTDAIALCPLSARKKQAIYYSNRAECHLRSKSSKKAIHDCNRSLCLDTAARMKVQWRRSKAYQSLDLDYPAWLDMQCLVKDWNMTAQQVGGVDFTCLHEGLSEQVGVLSDSNLSSVEQRMFNGFYYNVLVETNGVPGNFPVNS